MKNYISVPVRVPVVAISYATQRTGPDRTNTEIQSVNRGVLVRVRVGYMYIVIAAQFKSANNFDIGRYRHQNICHVVPCANVYKCIATSTVHLYRIQHFIRFSEPYRTVLLIDATIIVHAVLVQVRVQHSISIRHD